MYSIKLMHGHGMNMDTMQLIKTAYCTLLWENEDGKTEQAGQTNSIVWTEKTAKRVDKWAREAGLNLKAERGAYLRKHGERYEVVKERERKAREAERKRLRLIRERCAQKHAEIIALLKPVSPAMAHYLETGEDSLEVALKIADDALPRQGDQMAKGVSSSETSGED